MVNVVVVRFAQVWLAVISLVACSGDIGRSGQPGMVMNDSLRLTEDQRRRDEERARFGDIAAAKRLADEAMYATRDFPRAFRYYRIAASHGDKDAKATLSNLSDAK
jgi:TPR repeat protein